MLILNYGVAMRECGVVHVMPLFRRKNIGVYIWR